MVTFQLPVMGVLLIGFVWGMLVLLLSQYLTSGHKLINRTAVNHTTREPII